jgi:hypothetical protein
MWSACRCVSTALTSLRSSPYELEIAVDLFQHGVDDQRLAAVAAGEQVGGGGLLLLPVGHLPKRYGVGMSANQPACPTASLGLCSSRLRPVRRPG